MTQQRQAIAAGILLATTAAGPVLGAQADEAAAAAVEVSAYRVPVLLTETTQGVSIVNRQEIELRRPASTMDLLQELPGVQVDQAGPGGTASIYIRGSDPEQVLVLIDGVRVNDPMLSRGGSYDLSAIDPAMVERIEVLRGAGSAIYGADAMGGVVNIITRRGVGTGLHGSAAAGIGGQDYGHLNATLSGGNETVQAVASAAKLKDGRDEDGGTIDLGTLSGSINVRPSDAVDLKLFANHNERDSTGFPEASGGILFATIRTLEQRSSDETSYGANLLLAPWERVGVKLQLSRYERDEDIDSPGVAPGAGNPFGLPATVSNTNFQREAGLLSASIKLPLDSDLTVGYEYLHEEGNNNSVLDLPFIGPTPADFALSRYTNSGFAELIMRPMQTLIVQLDVRYDDVSGLGAETSPGVGVRYDIVATGTTLKARWAEGFRAPSFFALADPLVGNPNLVAETSQGGEIGLEQSLLKDMARFDLTLFRTRYKNLVDYDPTIGFFGQLVNRSNVDTQGIEATLDVRPTRAFGVKFGYTYLDADIVGSDQPLRNRPANRAFFALNYEFAERWLFSWNTAYVGEVDNFSVPTGDVQLDSYLLTDVALSYKWRQVTATFAIDNLFDERYQQFPGFENPGIRARASISGKF